MTTHLEHGTSRSAPLTRHDYHLCSFSGAGNCCCGRPEASALHPHAFTPMDSDPLRCVCSKPANWQDVHAASVGAELEGQA